MSQPKPQEKEQQPKAAAKEGTSAAASITSGVKAKEFFTEGLFGDKFKSTALLFGKDFDTDVVVSAVLKPVKDLSFEGKVSRVSGGQGNVAGVLSYSFNEFNVKAEGNVKSVSACMAFPEEEEEGKKTAAPAAASSSSSSKTAKKESSKCDYTGEAKLTVSSEDFLAAGLKLSAGAKTDLALASPEVNASVQYSKDEFSGKLEGAINVLDVGKSTIKASGAGSVQGFLFGGSAKVGVSGSLEDFDFGAGYKQDKILAGAAVAKKLSVINAAVEYQVRQDVQVALGGSVSIKNPKDFVVRSGSGFKISNQYSVGIEANSSFDVAVQTAAKISDALKGSVTLRANVLKPAAATLGASFKYEQQ